MSADDRRRQLIEIGADLLVSEPLENLTGQRLAELAGTSRGLIFHYFPTVRDLNLACLEEAARRLVRSIEEEVGRTDGEEEMFRVVMRTFVDYIGANPLTFSTLSASSVSDPDFGLVFDSARHRILEVILSRFEPTVSSYGAALVAGWIAFVESSVLEWSRSNPEASEIGIDEELIESLLKVLELTTSLVLGHESNPR